jgi:outer membrane protein TolC
MPKKQILAPIVSAAALAAVNLLTGCSVYDKPPFDPQHIQQIQREANTERVPHPLSTPSKDLEPSIIKTQRNGQQVDAPSPLSYLQSTTRPYGVREVPLTLREVIYRTASNNLESRVAGYQSAIDEVRILEAEARFDPLIFSQGQAQKTFPQNIGGGNLDPNQLLTQSLEGGFRQLMTTGGQAELKYQVQRQDSPQTSSIFGSSGGVFFTNDLVFQITQPILRDFGERTNLARITIARNDQKISQLDYRDKVEDQLDKVEQLYWRLRQAIRDVEIQQRLLQVTKETFDRIVERQKFDASLVQVSQVRSTLENRNVLLYDARAQVQTISDQIKAIMNDPDFPVSGPEVILPADEPLDRPIGLALSDQLETALQNRIELMQQKIRIDSATVVVGAAENNLLPKLDLSGSIGLEGVGKDFGDALRIQDDFSLITYAFGFQFEVPIGNRQARAIYQRTMLQRQQAIEQFYNIADQVARDVKDKQRTLETKWETYVAARRAVFAARDALDRFTTRMKEIERLSAETLELELTRQLTLAEAATVENRALAEYNIALEQLERAKGTLLRYNNVVLQEEKGPMFAKTLHLPWVKQKPAPTPKSR